MDYDPNQYRERHNASWDRIRHENAASVRSEPADWQFYDNNYLYNNFPNAYVAPENFQMEYLQNPLDIPVEAEEVVEDVSEDGDVEEIDRPDVYCMDCDSKIEDLNCHSLETCSASRPPMFECAVCRKSFNFEKNAKIHKVAEHSKAADFVRGTMCPFCPKDSDRTSFSRYTAFIGHVKMHLKSDYLPCEHCGTELENQRVLDNHIRREHLEDVYELSFCPKCQKVLSMEETTAHQLIHQAQNAIKTRQKPAKPPPGPSLPKKKVPAKNKQKKTIRSKKNVCAECQKAFVRPSELARHQMIHFRKQSSEIPKWKCAICQKEYAHKTGLEEHKKTAHGVPKLICCTICGISFTKKSNHTRHMLKIHPLVEEITEKPKFECPDCPTVFNTSGALTRHQRSCHLKQGNLKITKTIPIYERNLCKTCKREFRDKKMLEKHERTHLFQEHRWRDLQGGGERKCDYCEKSFVLRASLLWHMQKHFEEQQEEEPKHCEICDLHFENPLEYRQHFDEQHSVICAVCHQKFTSRQIYEDHICNRKFATRNLNSQNPVATNRVLICRLCRPPQRLTTIRQIKEHRAQHLPRKHHLCWTCHKSFKTAQLLSLHAEVHDRQPIQCTQCPQVLHSRVALKQHMRVTHGGDTNYQVVVHVDRSMAMSAQSFAEYGLAGDHADSQAHRAHSVTEWIDPEDEMLLDDSQEMRTNFQQQIPDQLQQQPIRCEVCHHLYNDTEQLCDHWQGSDIDTDHSFGIVTCPICETRIRGASEAANHLRSAHLFARPRIFQFVKTPMDLPVATISQSTSKKSHQCPNCSKSFGRKNDLERHLKIHTGEKSFKCPTCSACFRVKSTLKSHMARHTDNPPQFQCTVCQKLFYEKKTLVVHMRIHTGEQPFKCRYCDSHFRTPAMTRTHEKKCFYGGPPPPTDSDPSQFQPQYLGSQMEMDRTINQISGLPHHNLQLSRNSAFNTVQAMNSSEDDPIYIITKPITAMLYVIIVQKTRPVEGSMRYAVDTVSEIRIRQLRESTNLSIVLHNEMRLNVNTVKILEMVSTSTPSAIFKTRVTVATDDDVILDDNSMFTIIAKSSGASFIRRCEICEVDLPTKRISEDHFYSEDHETAQLMYPSNSNAVHDASSSDLNCKLCGFRFHDMNSLLNHIRREHDEPAVPPRPVAHTAPIN